MPQKIFDILPPKKPIRKQEIVREGPRVVLEKKRTFWPKHLFKRGLIFLLGFLVIVGISCQFILAQVEIEIWPKTEILELTEKVIVDSQIKERDFEKKIVPGRFLEEERESSLQFSSTGVKQKSTKAGGVIRVYNNYHISQTLVASTRFLSEGKLFRSQSRVYVPAGSYTEVEVEAVDPGPEYNIKPSTFSIPGLVGYPQYTSVYGRSFAPMKGGFVGEVPQVTQEDLKKAEEALLEKLKSEARESFKNKIGEGLVLLDEAVDYEVVDSSSVEAGQEAENFTFYMKIKIRALVFNEQDLRDFAREILEANISQDQKIQESSLSLSSSLESVTLQPNETKGQGKIALNLKFSAKAYFDIDKIAAKETLRNKSLKEARLLFEDYPEVERVQIRSWPFWMKKIPTDMRKIKIELNLD